ncbi:MAG: XRE family transcriptional regulator [Gammaproteobacteria bacterium]
MARKFSELKNRMSRDARNKADKHTRDILAEMPLLELRRAKALSQEQLAELLHIKQASVSKLERRTDMYIRTLRSYIEAMGGTLEINAVFPEGRIRINQFSDKNSGLD